MGEWLGSSEKIPADTAESKGGKSAISSCPQSKGDKQGIHKGAEEQGATAAAAYSETREGDECSIHREGSKKWVQITGEVQLTPLHGDNDNEEQRQDKQSQELMDMTLAALERVEELKKNADTMGQRLQTIELCHEDRMREFTKMREAQNTATQSVLQLRNEQTKISQKAAQMEKRLEARTSVINQHRGVKYGERESGVTTRSRTRTKYVKVSEARRRDDELEDEWVEEPEDSHDPEGEDKQKGGGVWVTLPEVIAHQYVVLGHKDERCALDKVYWLEINEKDTSDLWKEYTRWKLWLTHIRPDCREARDPWHCTIKYDEEGRDEDYGSLWEEQQEGQTYNVKVTNIIIGQQGIAAGVELPSRVEDWYQTVEAAPHITLMIGQEFESKDIGPMMREAGQLRDWMPTLNPKARLPTRQTLAPPKKSGPAMGPGEELGT
ncbi:hypothetical protein QTP86_017594 [Hemibagrus guttatus]|nr:hypothetical protein QTP86_017594 [Hemibagrus guttatus]